MPTRIQSAGGYAPPIAVPANTTQLISVSKSFPVLSTAGKSIIVYVAAASGNVSGNGISLPEVLDTQGNAYTQACWADSGNQSGGSIGVFITNGIVGGPNVITFRYTATTVPFGASSFDALIIIAEYSGFSSPTVQDSVIAQVYGSSGLSPVDLTITDSAAVAVPISFTGAAFGGFGTDAAMAVVDLLNSGKDYLVACGRTYSFPPNLPVSVPPSYISFAIAGTAGAGDYFYAWDGSPSTSDFAGPYFPDLPGKGWGWTRRLRWNTLVRTGASGLQFRDQLYPKPRWEWELPFNYIRANAPYLDFEVLAGFNNSMFGGLTSFLFRDDLDNQVTGQFIATGDGSTTEYQLVRTMGGYDEIIGGVDKRGPYTYGPYTRPAALVPQAFVNGSPVAADFNTQTGVMTLGSASGTSGHPITATFSYVWRVRFVNDVIDFKNAFSVIYGVDSLKLIQTRS